jgi:MinD-like ATPase involved in chromosome partitioning or flagellar assembly
VSVNLAAELADLGHAVVLVDADSYGGALGQLLGVPDDAPGVAAACRLAAGGTLDVSRLAAVALEVAPRLRLLTGISRPDRWRELRPAAFEVVIGMARSLAAYVVIDCGFCLETDDEIAADATMPRRNAATFATLAVADRIVGVASADPIGLARYVRAVPECLEFATDARLITVVNRLRRDVVGPGEPRRQVIAALDRYAGLTDVHVVPEDREALDRAIAAGRSLTESAPKSPARLALRELAVRVAGGRSAGHSGRRRAS